VPRPGGKPTLKPRHVQDQGATGDARLGGDRGKERVGIRHLWHPFRVHERAKLNPPYPGLLERGHERQLFRQAEGAAFVLQAVAQEFILDQHRAGSREHLLAPSAAANLAVPPDQGRIRVGSG